MAEKTTTYRINTNRTFWEYWVLTIQSDLWDEFNERLSHQGDEGWELVAVTELGVYTRFFFKRRKQ